jgi:hypothetical protein
MALTAPERWLVGGLGVFLLTCACTAALWLRDREIRRMIHSDFIAIEEACVFYARAHQRWPAPRDVLYDLRYGENADLPNAQLMNVLRAVDGPGNLGGILNPQQKVYLDLATAGNRRSGLTPGGEFVDPWGSPYQVILDLNNDNLCDIPETRFGSALGTRVAIWSYGPDRKPDTFDDRFSWR